MKQDFFYTKSTTALLLFSLGLLMCITNLLLYSQVNNLNYKVNQLDDRYYSVQQQITELEEAYSEPEGFNMVLNTLEAPETEDTIKTPTNRWNIVLSEEEIDTLAQIVYLEAGNQSLEGQMAVVEVILNRMIDPYYSGSLEDVLSKPGQFSTWKNRHNSKPSYETYAAINAVLCGESNILPFNTLYFARGSGGREVEKRIGDHVFCN